jgi:nitroreductase
MNQLAETGSFEPVCHDAVELLLTRHSVGPKHLVAPAPTEEQMWLALCAALRAPDHEKLVPYRFVLIADEARPSLGGLFADFARRCGKSDEEIDVERERAMRGPLLLAFVTRIENDHQRVTAHEQWLAAGGALSNFLTALHLMGFAAKMLSGRKAADPAIQAAFCEPGEALVGWIAAGTASKTPHPRENDNPDAILRRWRPPVAKNCDDTDTNPRSLNF